MKKLKAQLTAWYFEPASSKDLAFARILFFSFLLFFHFCFDNRPFWELPEELWQPVGVLSFFGFAQPSAADIEFLYFALMISLVFCLVGFLTSIFSVLALTVGILYWGFGQSIGHMFRIDCLVVCTLFVLCFSRMSDAFSIDSMLFRRRRPEVHFSYGWPMKVIQFLYSMIFFSAAVSKLVGGGRLWPSGEFFRFALINGYITRNGYHEKFLWNGIGKLLVDFPVLCMFIAIGILTFELSMPLACFSKKIRKVLLPMSIAFPFVVFLILGIPFFKHMAALPFWFKWEGAIKYWSSKRFVK